MTAPIIDDARVEQFAERILDTYNDAMLTLMIDLGFRTGLLDAAASGPATSAQLADRAGLTERYVREWLRSLVTGGIIEYDDTTGTFDLPDEHAVSLSGDGPLNLAPLSMFTALLGRTLPQVAEAFRLGGGVPYDEFHPEFTGVMDAMSRATFDQHLVDDILPLGDRLPSVLSSGARVADIGCGTGHSTNVMARAFPASTFVGYDIDPEGVAAGRTEAAEWGLNNVEFLELDVTRIPPEPPFDLVVAFDAIHDQVDPAGVLRQVEVALAPDGTFLMVDIKASSHLVDNLDHPLAPWLYAVSTLHCLTVSLAHDGAGLGTVWGWQLAYRMLAEAGFGDVSRHDVPDDPTNSVYVARKAR